MPSAVDVIQAKRDARDNDPEDISWFVNGAISGEVSDYQVAAWLMAVYLNGLNEAETLALTRAFVDSGRKLDFGPQAPPRVDKHSTGGVGDKTSLVIAPLAAAAGIWVPMISGRGLGFTGGTLDKLESIPGYRSALSLEDFQHQVRKIGTGIVSATEELAPGDRVFYRIRDVTATVESIPLIVASILSKKLAEDLQALVLDVKVGSGAVMKSLDDARELARALVDVGNSLGMKVVALLTDMSQPLGLAIGNALEVSEAVDVLKGGGPPDFRRLCLELTGWMLCLAGRAGDPEEGVSISEELLQSGRPFELFLEMVEAQGGNPRSLTDGTLPGGPPRQHLIRADQSGYLHQLRCDALGRSALRLGAGRQRAADPIDPLVGILLHHKVGESVKKGDPLATVYYNQQSRLDEALDLAGPAFEIGSQPITEHELIHEVVE